MQITQIRPDDRRAVRRFVDLPFRLFAGESRWVPPLRSEILSYLRRTHPFFDHSDAAFFLADRGGPALGRIAVLEHGGYNRHHGKEAAFFCFFDCEDDEDASLALFAAASDWARGRGLSSLLGPKGFVRTAGAGVLVEGFEHLPALGVPWNPPYFQRLFESTGFVKWTDFLSGYLDKTTTGDDRLERVAEIARKRGKFEVVAFSNLAELRGYLPQVKKIQAEAFADNPNYVPSTDAEFELQTRKMTALADLSIIRFIARDGEIAGFMGAFPNIGEGLRRSRGRLFPLGWLHLLRDKARSRILDLNGVGILPKYQKMGGDAILFTELERLIRSSRYETADFVQVDERNFLSKSGIEHFSIRWAKRHRVYEKTL
jgi:hypothetical protein